MDQGTLLAEHRHSQGCVCVVWSGTLICFLHPENSLLCLFHCAQDPILLLYPASLICQVVRASDGILDTVLGTGRIDAGPQDVNGKLSPSVYPFHIAVSGRRLFVSERAVQAVRQYDTGTGIVSVGERERGA